jgi:thiol-disulfide isomerase/thioredoxin
MKELFFNLALFVVLAAAFSSCNTNSNLQSGEPPAASNSTTANAGAPKKPSEYPPIATAIAESDIKNLDGSTFKIADKKGKVILLNMWATWCGPCRAEMPALVKMQDAFRDQGLEIVGLNSDDEPAEDINNFAKAMNLNYTLVWPDDKLRNDLLKISQFGGIPQSFLIDRDGNLRGVFRGANPNDVRKMETLVAKVVNGDDSLVPDTPRPDGEPASSKSDAASLPIEKPVEQQSDDAAKPTSK